MGIKEENLKLFGHLGTSTKRHPLPLDGTVLRDFWVPTKETKIMFSTSEFLDYCGMIGEPQEFIGVLIKPDGISGQFYPPRLLEMLEFCEWFPEYSILSKMPCGAFINQPRLGARFYLLANRNRSDERIVCHDIGHKYYRYVIAGYGEHPKPTLEDALRFLRAQGFPEAGIGDPDEN